MDEENEKPNLEKISEEPSVELIDELPNDIPEETIIESAPAVGSAPVIDTTVDSRSNQPHPKKSKKSLIIILLVAFILVGAAACCYFFWPRKTALDAFKDEFSSAENVALSSNNTFTFKDPSLFGAKSADINFSVASLELPTDLNAEVNIVTDADDEIFIKFAGKISASGELFLKVDNLENFLDDMNLSPIFGLIFGEDFYDFSISEFDGKWWEIDGRGANLLSSIFSEEDFNNEEITCQLNDIKLRESGIISVSNNHIKKNSKVFPLVIDSDKVAALLENVCLGQDITLFDLDDLAAKIGELPTLSLELSDGELAPRVYASRENSEYIFNSSTKILFENSKPRFETPEEYSPLSELLGLYYASAPIPEEIDEE